MEALRLNTHRHTHCYSEREEETKHNGCWRMGAGISWVSHTQMYNHSITNIYIHLETHCQRHCGLMNKSISPFTTLKMVREAWDSCSMNDPCSVSEFFFQTSVYNLPCLFKKTWIIRLRKPCEKEKRTTKPLPIHITFLAADSQAWERTLGQGHVGGVSWDSLCTSTSASKVHLT